MVWPMLCVCPCCSNTGQTKEFNPPHASAGCPACGYELEEGQVWPTLAEVSEAAQEPEHVRVTYNYPDFLEVDPAAYQRGIEKALFAQRALLMLGRSPEIHKRRLIILSKLPPPTGTHIRCEDLGVSSSITYSAAADLAALAKLGVVERKQFRIGNGERGHYRYRKASVSFLAIPDRVAAAAHADARDVKMIKLRRKPKTNILELRQ